MRVRTGQGEAWAAWEEEKAPLGVEGSVLGEVEGEEAEVEESALLGEAFWVLGEIVEGAGFFSVGQVIRGG